MKIVTMEGLSGKTGPLKDPIIHGLLRRGEVMNIVAPPKCGSTCLAIQLSVAISSGEQWLGFETTKSTVRYVNGELHADAFIKKVSDVCGKRAVYPSECGFFRVAGPVKMSYLDKLKHMAVDSPDRVGILIVDPVDTILPDGFQPNDNGSVTNFYNELDAMALETGSAIVLIHRATKQSTKPLEDIGAGAVAYSRASDTHVALHKHASDGRYVFDAATRSFRSPKPFCIDFKYPIWSRTEDCE